jgi:hypothetical protein
VALRARASVMLTHPVVGCRCKMQGVLCSFATPQVRTLLTALFQVSDVVFHDSAVGLARQTRACKCRMHGQADDTQLSGVYSTSWVPRKHVATSHARLGSCVPRFPDALAQVLTSVA